MKLAPQRPRTFFVTAVTGNRRPHFQVESNALLMLEVLQHYRHQGRYKLHAFVLMPDHIHLLLTPAPDISLEKAMQLIKGGYSFRLQSRQPVWQRSFNEHRILNQEHLKDHVRYIASNPVRAKLATDKSAYPYSSVFQSSVANPHLCFPDIC